MTETPTFLRLESAIRMIARHPFYPGKDDVVLDCLDDLEERCREGSLTLEQKTLLTEILTADGASRPAKVEPMRVSTST